MKDIKICSIVAIARNNVIGKDNALIWHLPEDLKHFKRTTLGKPIIMGRKSYEALGKPLPGRPNIVISRQPPLETTASGEGPFFVPSIEAAIAIAQTMAADLGVDEVFITGGGEIYKQTLPITERLYLTVLERDYEGDTFFPEINWAEWNILEEIKHLADPAKDRPEFTIYTLDRK